MKRMTLDDAREIVRSRRSAVEALKMVERAAYEKYDAEQERLKKEMRQKVKHLQDAWWVEVTQLEAQRAELKKAEKRLSRMEKRLSC